MVEGQESSYISSAFEYRDPTRIEPDIDFIQALSKQGDNSYKHCMQCGACSVVCSISPDRTPFPRKEMIWTSWGLKDRLIGDPDLWLCHQCNDCSTQCPRAARPGDVMAAVQQEIIIHFAFPRFLGRWAKEPKLVPLLLAIPAVLLGFALLARNPIEKMFGFSTGTGSRIAFSYSSVFPHWLLNSFFLFFSALVLVVTSAGVVRFWKAMKAACGQDEFAPAGKSMASCIVSALKKIAVHDDFTLCSTPSSKFLPHFCVFFGFIALSVVTLWVITSRYNPLIEGPFVYPFGFWNPLKIIANLGGAAVLAGCVLMISDRLTSEQAGRSTYSDWALLSTLLAVVCTGFLTEVLHYARMTPHRHVVYFIHLVFVFALIVYLPYSKFAHLVYRTAALAFAEFSGRGPVRPAAAPEKHKGADKNELQATKSIA